MIKVNVITSTNRWKRYIKKPEKYLNSKLKKIKIKNFFFKNSQIDFSLLLTESKQIKNLNKKFRKKNKSTDVLSFPSYEKKIMRKLLKTNSYIYIGDICINLDKIIGKNLKETRKNFNKIWIHGFVHLIGFDHFTDKKFYKMKKIEKKIHNEIMV
tara:strand:+ start:521 stop:985 length:465 start_codon:yes stop_codon:yes gene_type:complete